MIKEQQLIEYGFDKIDDFLPYSFIKHLSDNEKGDRLSIILTIERNTPEFALKMPDGNKLFLQVKNLHQLRTFEESIQSWEPNY